MTTSFSSYDPLFFFHHNMVDQLWDVWQRLSPANQHAFDEEPAAGQLRHAPMDGVGATAVDTLVPERMCYKQLDKAFPTDSTICYCARFGRGSLTGSAGQSGPLGDDTGAGHVHDNQHADTRPPLRVGSVQPLPTWLIASKLPNVFTSALPSIAAWKPPLRPEVIVQFKWSEERIRVAELQERQSFWLDTSDSQLTADFLELRAWAATGGHQSVWPQSTVVDGFWSRHTGNANSRTFEHGPGYAFRGQLIPRLEGGERTIVEVNGQEVSGIIGTNGFLTTNGIIGTDDIVGTNGLVANTMDRGLQDARSMATDFVTHNGEPKLTLRPRSDTRLQQSWVWGTLAFEDYTQRDDDYNDLVLSYNVAFFPFSRELKVTWVVLSMWEPQPAATDASLRPPTVATDLDLKICLRDSSHGSTFRYSNGGAVDERDLSTGGCAKVSLQKLEADNVEDTYVIFFSAAINASLDFAVVHPAGEDAPRGCMYDGNEYEVGAQWRGVGDDWCNTCTCGRDGSVACTELDCGARPPSPQFHCLNFPTAHAALPREGMSIYRVYPALLRHLSVDSCRVVADGFYTNPANHYGDNSFATPVVPPKALPQLSGGTLRETIERRVRAESNRISKAAAQSARLATVPIQHQPIAPTTCRMTVADAGRGCSCKFNWDPVPDAVANTPTGVTLACPGL